MAPLDFSPLERELTREEGQRFRREASEGVYGERARAEEDSQRAGCSCAAAGLGLFLVGLALVGLVVVVAQGEADAGWFSLFLIVPAARGRPVPRRGSGHRPLGAAEAAGGFRPRQRSGPGALRAAG